MSEFSVDIEVPLFPGPRRKSPLASEDEVERFDIERMSYEVIIAHQQYNEDKVVSYVNQQLSELEQRLGIKFVVRDQSLCIKLPTNREREIAITDANATFG